jgi:hypothetical protein
LAHGWLKRASDSSCDCSLLATLMTEAERAEMMCALRTGSGGI